MSDQHTAFVGSIPENYDRYPGPCLFEPYALDIVLWDSIDKNELTQIAHETVSSFFENDPPTFYKVPFELHERGLIMDLLTESGVRNSMVTFLQRLA